MVVLVVDVESVGSLVGLGANGGGAEGWYLTGDSFSRKSRREGSRSRRGSLILELFEEELLPNHPENQPIGPGSTMAQFSEQPYSLYRNPGRRASLSGWLSNAFSELASDWNRLLRRGGAGAEFILCRSCGERGRVNVLCRYFL